jgi:hypothetical protein
MSEILKYLEDEGYWEQWLMEGKPSVQRAASLLPVWLSHIELNKDREETFFWTHRASIFYSSTQWANQVVYGEWGIPAEYLSWENFLDRLSALPPEKRLLFNAGKFRTLPTGGQVESVVVGQKWKGSEWWGAINTIIFEPKENIEILEGDKLVFDPKIRTWAYSLLPGDYVTSFPIMQKGEDRETFYSNRSAEIRAAFSGIIGAGIGTSSYAERAAINYEGHDIKVVDTSITNLAGKGIYHYDTSELDKISANSGLIQELLLSYLRHMGQITV